MTGEAVGGVNGQDAAIWSVPGRPTRIVVDLDAISGNVRYFAGLVTAGTAVMAVVKADGYGHGAAMVAREAVDAGASHLAVATVDEGVALRRFGVRAPILVLGPIDISEILSAIDASLAITAADLEFVDAISAAAQRSETASRISIHVKIDSGMRRFGAMPEHAVALCRRVAARPQLRLDGFYSHFADADGPSNTFSVEQSERFDTCLGAVREAGINPGLVHLSNSAAALRWRRFDRDLVRIGIALYGLSPSPALRLPMGLRPALSLRSRITRIAQLRAGETVSYGRTYEAEEDERIGLVPIGYADGYRRDLSNLGTMSIRGVSLPVRGRVCMDQTVVGLPMETGIRIGAEIEVISADPTSGSSVPAIAKRLRTIDYEVVTGLARRIPRIYVKGGQVVAVQDLHTVRLVSDPN